MAALSLRLSVPDALLVDVEELLCGFGKLLSMENKISAYSIEHLAEVRRPKRGPYSPEEE